MNEGVHSELDLNYEVAVELNYDNQLKTVDITNKGKTTIDWWGVEGSGRKPLFNASGQPNDFEFFARRFAQSFCSSSDSVQLVL